MPSSREDRVERLFDGLSASSYTVTPGYDASAQPLLLDVTDGHSLPLAIFSWAVTHGGATRDPSEYRVQTTRPEEGPLLVEGRQSLILGYDDDREVFAAWDVRVHPNPGRSSSLQVPASVLDEAASEGFAARHRETSAGEELVVAFRPEAIGTYLEMLPDLPGPNTSEAELRAVDTADDSEDEEIEELPIGQERKEALRRIRVRSRDRRFRTRVLDAYDGRCVFCGVGAGLAHAAHIQGVADDGPDLVANGIAACPTHHTAFDQGLLLIEDDHRITVDEARLRHRGVSDDDVSAFRGSVGERIAPPRGSAPAPAPEYLRAHRERFSE